MADQKTSGLDIFECEVCFERYNLDGRRPKVLPCGHTICLTCLLNQVKRGNFLCPQCRQVCPNPDPRSLPDNYLLCPYLERGDDVPKKFFCYDCQIEASDSCMEQHCVRNMTSVVLKQVQDAKAAAKKQFQQEDSLLKEFIKMLQSTKDSVEKTLLPRITKETEEFQERAKEIDNVAKVIDQVPGTAFQDNGSVAGIIDSFLSDNSLRVFFFEEQKRMLEVAKRCTLTVTSEDAKVSWDVKVAVSKKSAPEEKVLSYLLFVMMVNQSQRREEELRQTPPESPALGAPLPAGNSSSPGPPSAPSLTGSASSTWKGASWAAAPWPDSNSAARLEELMDKVKRCVVDGVTQDDDSDDSDGFTVISEVSVPEQFRSSKRLFVDGLPGNATPDEVKAVFSKCGRVNYVRILDGKKRKKGRLNCALVYFPDDATIENVLRNRPFAFQRKGEWNRVPLKVVEDRRAQKRDAKVARKTRRNRGSEKPASQTSGGGDGVAGNDMKIYVGNVPLDITENQLHALFSIHGRVLSVNLRRHGAGQKNFGFAFVTYADVQSVQRVLGARPIIFYGHNEHPRGLDLQVKEFQGKGSGAKPQQQDGLASPEAATAAFAQAMSVYAANAASLQLQANAASMQAAAAVLNQQGQQGQHQGLYPTLPGAQPSAPPRQQQQQGKGKTPVPLMPGPQLPQHKPQQQQQNKQQQQQQQQQQNKQQQQQQQQQQQNKQQQQQQQKKQPQQQQQQQQQLLQQQQQLLQQQQRNNNQCAGAGLSYDDVLRSTGTRGGQQQPRNPPSGKRQGKAENDCSVM